MKATIKKNHPLKRWLDYWSINAVELATTSGVLDSSIRHIYGKRGIISRKNALKLYNATGIPPEVLMFPERFPGFDISACKPQKCITA
ncbi:MAG: hypothetical protein V3W26_04925, partial [Thermodesulfobacteriota bacterium]